jgi:hypothetical protein
VPTSAGYTSLVSAVLAAEAIDGTQDEGPDPRFGPAGR